MGRVRTGLEGVYARDRALTCPGRRFDQRTPDSRAAVPLRVMSSVAPAQAWSAVGCALAGAIKRTAD